MPKTKRRCSAFTIVELLVVIAIIGMLVSLLLPAIQQAREAGRRSQCSNNLKQIGVAYHCYESSYGSLPPAYISDPTKTMGWGIFILPYLELKTSLYDYYNFKKPFYDTNATANIDNQRIANTQIPYFMCPSAPIRVPYEYTFSYPGYPSITWQASASDYSPLAGGVKPVMPGVPDTRGAISSDLDTYLTLNYTAAQRMGALEADKKTSVSFFTDGASHTIMVAEIAGKNDLWINGINMRQKLSGNYGGEGGWADPTSPASKLFGSIEDGSACPGPLGVNVSNEYGLYSFHRMGANVLMADGSVTSLLVEIDIRILVGMLTRAGGEVDNIP
jgi:prepilin-type N-terminal cleavage/methylation domain-containing protein/prepilin-type processing-associated H-X9-DG protein